MAIELEGLEGVLEALQDIEDTEQLESVLTKCCLLVERTAKQKALKDTGELRRSITSEVRNNGTALEGVIYTPLEYAPYVEYGTGLFAENGGRQDVPWNYKDDEGNWHSTSGMKPQPFMRPAFNENRERIIEMIKESVANE